MIRANNIYYLIKQKTKILLYYYLKMRTMKSFKKENLDNIIKEKSNKTIIKKTIKKLQKRLSDRKILKL